MVIDAAKAEEDRLAAEVEATKAVMLEYSRAAGTVQGVMRGKQARTATAEMLKEVETQAEKLEADRTKHSEVVEEKNTNVVERIQAGVIAATDFQTNAFDSPEAMSFMKLKKWLVVAGMPKVQVDRCIDKEGLLRMMTPEWRVAGLAANSKNVDQTCKLRPLCGKEETVASEKT